MAKNNVAPTESEILAELAASYVDYQQRPDEITVPQFCAYMRKQGVIVTAAKARGHLERMVAAGRMVKRAVAGTRSFYSQVKNENSNRQNHQEND